MRPPAFWYDRARPLGRILAPLGWIYAAATARRLRRPGWQAPIPVVCVGNLTAGGAGKTPIVRDLVPRLAALGLPPHLLSRGYGGKARGPLQVDPECETAERVGDEPLLLARTAPCWISADRAAGAKAIAAAGGSAIIMDDGFQNPDLAQDLRLLVVDGETGFGNGRAIPAGPLRESIAAGLGRAHAMIIVGTDRHGLENAYARSLPVLRAKLVAEQPAALRGQRVLGFAGIGRPRKFWDTLAAAGAEIAGFHEFPDHHAFSAAELERLAEEAARLRAAPVTTEKDWVRLDPAWRARIRPVPVVVQYHDPAPLERLLAGLARD